MENIIPPVSRKKLLEELTEDKFIRKTNNAGNLLFIIDYNDSPNIMREIGRLRELSFRTAGGGTGKSVDIDDYDKGDVTYKQIILWKMKSWGGIDSTFVMNVIVSKMVK